MDGSEPLLQRCAGLFPPLGVHHRLNLAAVPILALLFLSDCARKPELQSVEAPPIRTQAREPWCYEEVGLATWYGSEEDGFSGRNTASGQLMDPDRLTCAHRSLPFGTLLEIHHLENDRKIQVQVNDRGPFTRGRIVDLSRRAALELGLMKAGTAKVRLRALQIPPQSLQLTRNSEKSESFTESKALPHLDSTRQNLRSAPPSTTRSFSAKDSTGGPCTIQLVSLRDAGNLERLLTQLGTRFGPVRLKPIQGRDGHIYQRVCVGEFDSQEEAFKISRDLLEQLQIADLKPVVTSLE